MRVRVNVSEQQATRNGRFGTVAMNGCEVELVKGLPATVRRDD